MPMAPFILPSSRRRLRHAQVEGIVHVLGVHPLHEGGGSLVMTFGLDDFIERMISL